MRSRGSFRPFLCALAISLALATGAAADAGEVVDGAQEAAQTIQGDPGAAAADPQGALAPVAGPNDPPGTPPIKDPAQAPAPGEPGFSEQVRASFQDQLVLAGLATVVVAGVGLAGFALVSRYLTPKEALKNPQRAMLYGFVKGNPGVHLKRLSEEFHMKTSSILWHIRKLECAELVHSERANGFRVFYPTAGGVEVRNVSRAVTALQNTNAYQLFLALATTPGGTPTRLAETLRMNAGTARWHLKKLKDFGLVEEVPGPEGARYLPTPLGQKAFASMSSTGASPAAQSAAVPA